MQDHYDDNTPGLESPADHAFAITPDDDTDLDFATRAFYVGTAGDVKVDTVGGNTVVISNCQAGSYHPIRVKRVYANGTTASDILGLY